MKKIINEVIERLKADSPAFFVKLKYLGASITAMGASLQVIPHAPERIFEVGINLIVAGGVMAAISQLTTKGPDQK